MDPRRTLIALRDFFAARDGAALAAALAALGSAAAPAQRVMAPPAAGPDDIEFAFNRLFVGPGALDAPPYASVYLDTESRLMAESTRQAAAVYDALGLHSPLSGSLPDDHIALELDALVAFAELREGSERNDRPHGRSQPWRGAELDALWRWFLCEHVARWVPPFLERVRAARDVPPAIAEVATQLAAWLATQTAIATALPETTGRALETSALKERSR